MKDIKDYLHLHLGCQIWTGTGYVTLIAIQKETVSTVFRLIVLNGNQIHEIEWNNDCRLALRPLSDMTDAEFKELIMLEWGVNRDIVEQKIKTVVKSKEVKHAVKYGTSIPFRAFDESGNHVMTGTISSESLNPEQFQYILSKGFDLFGLIEAGLAINKTKFEK